MTTLSIVIPAYNEENGIAEIAQRVLSIRPALESVGVSDLELIVVDDGSKDKTAEVAGSIPGVNLVQHPKNIGYGAALKTGFAHASGDLIGFLDADGTYPPEYFPQLCVKALDGSELVIGSRMAGAKSQMPITRRVGNLFFASLLTLIGRYAVTDSASGMRVFRREVLERIYPLPDGLNLTPVMSTRAIHEGIQMAEVPIPYDERVGRSKLSVVRDGSIFLQSMVWTVLTYNPVRIFGLIGIGGIAVAGLVALGLVITRLSGVTRLGPWGVAALFWALVSGVGGISVFALGTTFNYLVSLFYRRPIRQGTVWPASLYSLLGLSVWLDWGCVIFIRNYGGYSESGFGHPWMGDRTPLVIPIRKCLDDPDRNSAGYFLDIDARFGRVEPKGCDDPQR